jgi:TolB-like protein/Flp pilus assembly protein TadD
MAATYILGPFRLDAETKTLFRGGEPVSLGHRAVALLRVLVERRGIPVSKDALMEAAWAGLTVEEANLAVQISALRRVFGEEPGGENWIETLPRRGYRFVGPASIRDQGAVTAASQVANFPGSSNPTLPDRPSIAVLPFANISGDPEQEYFVDGVTESLTTDLSRISGAFVIARNTAFTFKGKAVDVKKLGRELSVRYVLEGSVQRSGNRLRVNVQLVDAETGNHLWAERFDKPVGDLFDMQDEIVSRLANSLNAELITAEARRAERSPRAEAMDLIFQGRSWFNKGMTPDNLAQARSFFAKALALDPENVEAMVGLARVDVTLGGFAVTDDSSARFAAAEKTITKALALAPNHALAHWVLGVVQVFTKRATQGIAQCAHALALDHNLAGAHALIGYAKTLLGRGAETEGHINEALRLSPRDTGAPRWFVWGGIAKAQVEANEETVVWLRRGLEANRNFSTAHFHLAAALARLGELDEAHAAVQTGLALDPSFTIRRYRDAAKAWSDNLTFLAGYERIIEWMRVAGVPEG